LYKDTKDIVYFTVNEETIEDAKSRYSYHSKTKEFVTIGVVPNFMDKTYSLNSRSHTLTWIIGGGMGLGYGIRALNTIIQNHFGPIVVVCGDNKRWYNKVLEAKEKNRSARIFALKYCTPESIKELMQNSNIIIGKPGGSTMAEFVSMQGNKILYGAVKGHEEQNGRYAQSLGIATYCETPEELARTITKPVYTRSIYDVNVIEKHPADYIVEYTLKYL
jgi:UDP-N-acetylglucosamine:LPS N-acetylglucosamine transferase